jgi:hypothetical protein
MKIALSIVIVSVFTRRLGRTYPCLYGVMDRVDVYFFATPFGRPFRNVEYRFALSRIKIMGL